MNAKRTWVIAAFVLAVSASFLTAAPGLGLDVNLGWFLDVRVGEKA